MIREYRTNDKEDMEQETEEITIRKAKWKFALGLLLSLLGLAVLFAGIMLDISSVWGFVAGIIGCLACTIGGVVLMVKASNGLALSDIQKIEQKYGKQKLTKLHGMKKFEAVQTLRSHGFEMDDSGYYRKKRFSFWKDSVTYYVKLLDSSDMEKTVQNECKYFDKQVQSGNNICLILMLYSREPDTELLRKAGMLQIADNMVLDMYSSKTMVVVGVDPVTGIGRYLDMGKGHNLYLYKYGCKMLKKLFG